MIEQEVAEPRCDAPAPARQSGSNAVTDRAGNDHAVGGLVAKAIVFAVVVVAVQGLLAMWFAWPATEAAPRDLPIVVAGPASSTDALTERLRTEHPGAFEISTVADAATADARLRDRAAYGAFVLGPEGLALHVASAASPAVATALAQAAGPAARVVDVVPASSDDPRGAGLAAAFLPLVLTSIGAGVLLGLFIRRGRARFVGILCYGVFAGLSIAVVFKSTGILDGEYPAIAASTGLLALAIAASVTGLISVLGRAGIAVGMVLVFVLGNPLSGLTSAPELLPQPWGEIGQYLAPGAGASLVRSVGFFDGARSTVPALVLGGYVVIGLLLVMVAALRRRAENAAAAV